MNESEQITYFAETDFRNERRRFGIKASDRTRHVYVIGKTGTGKSALLEHMAIADIQNGNGLAFLDPHGTSAEKLLNHIPLGRVKDVVYFSVTDTEYPLSFNVMEDVGYNERHIVVSLLMDVCEKILADVWNERVAYVLENIFFALLEYPGATLLDVNRMLTDAAFRQKVAEVMTDPQARSFWAVEFMRHTDHTTREAILTIQNKFGQFVSHPTIRSIVGNARSSFDIRRIMDERKILIVNFSHERLGEQTSAFLGGMLVTSIYCAALSRAALPPATLARKPNFSLYMDEFPSYTHRAFGDIVAEARKYKLNLTIAHQYIEQVEEEVRSAVFGNVGTLIVFRVGSFDAEIFEKEFAPHVTAEDIAGLGVGEMYLRLMIDGIGSKPFWAVSLAPASPEHCAARDRVIASSREQYRILRREAPPRMRKNLTASESETAVRKEKFSRPRVRAPMRTPVSAPLSAGNTTAPRYDFVEQKKDIQSKPPFLPPRGAIEEKTEEDEAYISLADLGEKTLSMNDFILPTNAPVERDTESQNKDVSGKSNPIRTAAPLVASAPEKKETPRKVVPEEIDEDVLRKILA